MDNKEYLEIIEGLLFLSGDEGLDVKQIADVLEIDKKHATNLIDELVQHYANMKLQGITIVNYGGIFKMATNPKYHMYYQKMISTKEATLSNAALETLAIIAYNQPITRNGVEEIRGVGCDNMIRKLIAKALIKEVGREESPGKPILYGVTDEFMDSFGLASLDELPDLEDIVELDEQEDIFNTRYHEDVSKEKSNEEVE